jgi:gamma-glutamyltranspeptidase / glutathione hydrolase
MDSSMKTLLARSGFLTTLVVLSAACAPTGAPPAVAPDADLRITDPTAQVSRSTEGMVSSASPWATEAGARVLAAGGTAVDAAVATGFALAVTEPTMSGIAGRASIVLRLPDGTIHGIDGLNAVPQGYESGGSPGYERAAVPGAIAALARLQAEHGSWSLARVMEPSIRLAEEGFILPEAEAGRFAAAAEDLADHPGSREAFLKPNGQPWGAGERFVQPGMARVLRAVAEGGVEAFYTGWIADSIHADMERSGGFITRSDLAAYRALDAVPVSGSYRGHIVHGNFRPASGHTVIQALQTLEEIPGSDRLLRDDGAWGALVGQAMHFALQDRNRREGSELESAHFLTSPGHARDRAAEVRVPELPDREVRRSVGPVGVRAEGGEPWRPGQLVTDPADREATTHFTVADRSGTVVAVTQSLGPSMGTRVASPSLGFLYATRLGTTPGSRPSSTITPTLVLARDGTPFMALGGAGDARIISAVIQVISRRIDQGRSLEGALAAPRLHPINAGEMRVEETGGAPGWTPAARSAFEPLGLALSTAPPGYFGRVHAVEFADDGLLGVAEPRWGGSAAGPLTLDR